MMNGFNKRLLPLRSLWTYDIYLKGICQRFTKSRGFSLGIPIFSHSDSGGNEINIIPNYMTGSQ